jgi:TrmH family RNA methyltransferase
MTPNPLRVSSRGNPTLALVRRLLRDSGAYRKGAAVWLEGDHLLRACLARSRRLQTLIVADSAWEQTTLQALAPGAQRVLLVADALFKELSSLPSPACIGALIELPAEASMRNDAPTLILDRVQDAGNVGSILRSAAAMGVEQVLALKGTAALWSPKVLRAGMGAHFGLQLHEALSLDDLAELRMPWVATSSHAATLLHQTQLPSPCAWVFGHEGQGVAPDVGARCAYTLRIAQPGGEESLNVAAAVAICLYEGFRQRS